MFIANPIPCPDDIAKYRNEYLDVQCSQPLDKVDIAGKVLIKPVVVICHSYIYQTRYAGILDFSFDGDKCYQIPSPLTLTNFTPQH